MNDTMSTLKDAKAYSTHRRLKILKLNKNTIKSSYLANRPWINRHNWVTTNYYSTHKNQLKLKSIYLIRDLNLATELHLDSRVSWDYSMA